eukprot:TRINITY_DN13665_c0_g4_i3.p1 TRINITY_DN13665_c0_g4~~TRINITY_DN13665_c0_g4_i3.p1  ORF type:complete len:751 (+),score=155.12 TRINITY_DN13665_c0_g4_i3:37-2289(+)
MKELINLPVKEAVVSTQSTGVYWGDDDRLVSNGYMLETTSPVGRTLVGDVTNTIDDRPTIWNTPHVFMWDWTGISETQVMVMFDLEGTIKSNLVPGSWVLLWSYSNLGINETDPKEMNPLTSFVDPDAVIAYRYLTSDTFNSGNPPTDGWQSRDDLYVDLLSDPVFTFPKIAENSGRVAWYVLLETSDPLFAFYTGANYVPALDNLPDSACDYFVYFPSDWDPNSVDPGAFHPLDNKMVFTFDGGLVGNNGGQGPISNENYTPIKRFVFMNQLITVNTPLVTWGDDPGQTLVMGYDPSTRDMAPCSKDIRSNLPSDVWQPFGPPGCLPDHPLDPLASYGGGQLLRIDKEGTFFGVPSVTLKLHRSYSYDEMFVPYFSVWDCSDFSMAGLLGVPVSTRLKNAIDSDSAVSYLAHFANGVPKSDGGPLRFQSPLVPSYADDDLYTSLFRIFWLFYNCDSIVSEDMNLDLPNANLASGSTSYGGNGIDGFDPNLVGYDAFQVRGNLKRKNCTNWVINVLGDEGPPTWDQVSLMLDVNLMFVTDDPPGALISNGMGYFTIANQPQALYLDTWLSSDLIFSVLTGRVVVFFAFDDSLTWWVQIDGGELSPVLGCRDQECYALATNQSDWETLVMESSVGVFPGDQVVVVTSSYYTPHGFVFLLNSALDGFQSQFDLYRFFDVLWDEMDFTFDTVEYLNDNYYTYGTPTYNTGFYTLFSGVVLPTALDNEEDIPMELIFSDYVYGMSVRLVATTTA